MPPPRPASGDTIYNIHTSGSVKTRCPYTPASSAHQRGLVTLTFDLLTLKVMSQLRVTWATSVSILVFLGLSLLDLRCTLQSDRCQTASSLNAPAWGIKKLLRFRMGRTSSTIRQRLTR